MGRTLREQQRGVSPIVAVVFMTVVVILVAGIGAAIAFGLI